MLNVETACHTAHLDDCEGFGLLVFPDPAWDIADPFDVCELSIHEADRLAVLDLLSAQGWSVQDDDWGEPLMCGVLVDGRECCLLIQAGAAGDPEGWLASHVLASLAQAANVERWLIAPDLG